MDQISNYIDRDGFVKSHIVADDASGDGVILTVVAGLLGVVDLGHVDSAVLACIDHNGCLRRRPDNSGGNQSHDGWMALAVWLQYRKYSVLARGLLLSALTRGFYMKHHEFHLEGKSLWQKFHIILDPWLIRHPRIWLALLVAAYPNAFVTWICSRLLQIMTCWSSVDTSDASGCQLKFVDRVSLALMGNKKPMQTFLQAFRDKGTSLAEVMSEPPAPYWDRDHVVISGYRDHEQRFLT